MRIFTRLQGPIIAAALALALGAAVRAFKYSMEFPEILRTAHKIPLILAVAWGLSRVLGLAFELATEERPRWKNSGAIQLLRGAGVLIIWATAGLLGLETVGISVTPILASLGVGSLAVALAAQDTLGNLFSGLYIQLDEPARLGDRVRLESGHEGWIREIGWRSTRIELLSGELLVVPNTKLAGSLLRNLSQSPANLKGSLEVALPFRGEPIEVWRGRLKSAASGAGIPLNDVMASQFVEGGVLWAFSFEAPDGPGLALARHELIVALDRAFRLEGIQPMDSSRFRSS